MHLSVGSMNLDVSYLGMVAGTIFTSIKIGEKGTHTAP